MLWAFSHKIILPVREKTKGKIYFKSVLSLLIGMMETSLICLLHSTTKSFKMPCPNMLTVLPTTCDKLQHPGCSQHEPQPLCSPPLEPGLGPHQPTQSPGGQKITMTVPKRVGLYRQNTCRECAQKDLSEAKSKFDSSGDRLIQRH